MQEITLQKYNRIFWDKVTQFDTTNDNILRKIIHSYSVAEKCFMVASKLELDKHQREFCYLIGLFHDLGRFKQWQVYHTYVDKLSINHADLSAQMLKEFIDIFELTERENEILLSAIKYHNQPYLGQDKDIIFYRNIVMDCDAFSNVISTANGIQQMMTSTEDGVTQSLLNDFMSLKSLLKYVAKTKLDRALILTSCCYSISFDFLRKEILDKKSSTDIP